MSQAQTYHSLLHELPQFFDHGTLHLMAVDPNI